MFFVLLVGLNISLAATSKRMPDDCYKCCGYGSSQGLEVGHRDCNGQATDCHVSQCPQSQSCGGYSCSAGDRWNDVCAANEDGWGCDDFGLHFCH